MGEVLLASLQRTIRTERLLPVGSRVVVGVSGGPDSVALLHLFLRMRARLHVQLHMAHLDHGLRPESRDDALFVQRLGVAWGVASTIERRDVSALCARARWSLEEGARRVRYQFFLEVARRQSADYLALAHTADDQAETVLMRLMRGTGLMGLSAIPIKRWLDDSSQPSSVGVWVVRPLLPVWRRDLLAYLKEEQLEYREDATNTDYRFVRNRIRHELLPLLERQYNPNIKGALTQLAQQSSWDYAYLQEAARRQWKRLVRSAPSQQVSIAIQPFIRQPKALQRELVRQAIARLRGDLREFEFRHWLEAERLFLERPVGTLLDLPGGIQLRREKERVICQLVNSSPS